MMFKKAYVFTLFLCFCQLASTEEIILQNGLNNFSGTDDTSIYENQPENTNGGGNYLYAGATSQSVRRALIRFDLSTIPEQAIVESVSLHLVVNRSGSNSSPDEVFSLHRVTRSWGEGDVDAGEPGGNGASAEAGDATWSDAQFQQTPWTMEGGDFLPTASVSMPVSDEPSTELIFSSAEMAADVQQWLSDAESNHGWIVIGSEDQPNSARRFVSSEGNREQRPGSLWSISRNSNRGMDIV